MSRFPKATCPLLNQKHSELSEWYSHPPISSPLLHFSKQSRSFLAPEIDVPEDEDVEEESEEAEVVEDDEKKEL